MGQPTTASGTTILNNVFVPDLYVIPFYRIGEGSQIWTALAGYIHGAIDLGIAEETLGFAMVSDAVTATSNPSIVPSGTDSTLETRVSTLLPGLPPSRMKANDQKRNENKRLEWNNSW